MRPFYVAVACAALALTGCSDRPNDLATYYEDPAEQEPTRTQASKVANRADQAAPTASVTASPPATPDLSLLLLADEEVAEEGVHRMRQAAPPASGCLAALHDEAVNRHAVQWAYPTGSRLRHQVAELPEAAATAVRSASCDGRPVELAAPAGAEAHRGWCEPGRNGPAACTVVLARGRIASAVQVSAQDVDRAREAVVRLAPIAGRALARTYPS